MKSNKRIGSLKARLGALFQVLIIILASKSYSSAMADDCITISGPDYVMVDDSAFYSASGSVVGGYSWSSASGTLTIDPDTGEVDAGNDPSSSEGDEEIDVVDSDGNQGSKSITVLKVEVTEVGIKDGHEITQYEGGKVIDESQPTWTKDGNPDYPACYTINDYPTLFAKLKLTPLISSTVSAKININTNDTDIVGSHDVNLTGDTVDIPDFVVDTAIPKSDAVRKTDSVFSWSVTFDEGNNYTDIGDTTHKLYWIAGDPKTTELYDLTFDRAVATYINGDSDYQGKVNSGIDGDLYYDPAHSPVSGYNSGDGSVLQLYYDGSAECNENAFLLKYLLDSIGTSGGQVEYHWGGVNASEKTRYFYTTSGGTGVCSFRCDRPQHDGAEANPRFTFHAMTRINGTLYDPSYGVTDGLTLTEFAPADKDNPPTGNFPGSEDVDWDGDCVFDTAASEQSGSEDDYLNASTKTYPYLAP